MARQTQVRFLAEDIWDTPEAITASIQISNGGVLTGTGTVSNSVVNNYVQVIMIVCTHDEADNY